MQAIKQVWRGPWSQVRTEFCRAVYFTLYRKNIGTCATCTCRVADQSTSRRRFCSKQLQHHGSTRVSFDAWPITSFVLDVFEWGLRMWYALQQLFSSSELSNSHLASCNPHPMFGISDWKEGYSCRVYTERLGGWIHAMLRLTLLVFPVTILIGFFLLSMFRLHRLPTWARRPKTKAAEQKTTRCLASLAFQRTRTTSVIVYVAKLLMYKTRINVLYKDDELSYTS